MAAAGHPDYHIDFPTPPETQMGDGGSAGLLGLVSALLAGLCAALWSGAWVDGRAGVLVAEAAYMADLLAAMALAGALAVLPVLVVCSLARWTRWNVVFSTLLVACASLVVFLIMGVAEQRHRDAMAAHLAHEAAPLVAAIHQYTAEHGAPPAELADLVPTYLAGVPSTGWGAEYDFHYRVEPSAIPTAGDGGENAIWSLMVNSPYAVVGREVWAWRDGPADARRWAGALVRGAGEWVYRAE